MDNQRETAAFTEIKRARKLKHFAFKRSRDQKDSRTDFGVNQAFQKRKQNGPSYQTSNRKRLDLGAERN